MRVHLILAAALVSFAALAQPSGRQVLVRNTVWIPGTTVRVYGRTVQVPGRNAQVEQWVWVPHGQPDPPNRVRPKKGFTPDIDIPAIVVPEVSER